MHECPLLSTFCSYVLVDTLRCADPPVQETIPNFVSGFTFSEVNSESKHITGFHLWRVLQKNPT